MKLKLVPFANAITMGGTVVYLIFWILSVLFPPLFKFLFNAQFMGADVAAKYHPTTDLITSIFTLIGFMVGIWILGYLWAYFYNLFSKNH